MIWRFELKRWQEANGEWLRSIRTVGCSLHVGECVQHPQNVPGWTVCRKNWKLYLLLYLVLYLMQGIKIPQESLISWHPWFWHFTVPLQCCQMWVYFSMYFFSKKLLKTRYIRMVADLLSLEQFFVYIVQDGAEEVLKEMWLCSVLIWEFFRDFVLFL